MDLVDLFCGGGGSSSGFHRAGFKTVCAIDLEKHCINTFNSNHGDIAFRHDISKLRSEKILSKIKNRPTIVTASPPCEPFTPANNKRIPNPFLRLFDDSIGRLMLHSLRIIADLDPDYYFVENVKGIIEGENKKLIQEEIADLGLGKCHFNWINAPIWGVPSERVRIIISNLKLTYPKSKIRTTKDAIGDLPIPDSPNSPPFHSKIPINEKFEFKVVSLKSGQGLVYYYGANQEYQNYVRIAENKPAPVIMGKSRFIHPIFDRLLTHLEHARLMTFPDFYEFKGNSDQIFDIIGEAVPPEITHKIGVEVKNRI